MKRFADGQVWLGLLGPLLILGMAVLSADRVRAVVVATRTPNIFDYMVAMIDGPVAILWIGVVALSWFVARGFTSVRAWLSWLDANRYAVALVCLAAYAFGAVFVMQRFPVSADEYAVVFQSKVFAAGEIYGQVPPEHVRRLFIPWMVPHFFVASSVTGQVVSVYWPGFSLVLAPFVLLGVPWLCNPVLGAVTLLASRNLCQRLFDDPAANGAVILFFLASGAHAATSYSFYTMSAHLLLNMVFVDLLLRDRAGTTFLAGLVGGFALALHNPFPHAVFAAPWILDLLWRRRWRQIAALGLGYLGPAVVLLWGWSQIRGGVMPERLEQVQGLEKNLGVFAVPGKKLLMWRWLGTLKLFVWLMPLSVPLALHGLHLQRGNRRVWLLAASALSTYLAFFVVNFSQGGGWGYRYMHPAIGVILVMAAIPFAAPVPGRAARTGVVASIVGALFIVPVLSGAIGHHVHALLEHRMTFSDGAPRVVFLARKRDNQLHYHDLLQNDPFLRDPTVYLESMGRQRDARYMRTHFPKAVMEGTYSRGTYWRLADDQTFTRPEP